MVRAEEKDSLTGDLTATNRNSIREAAAAALAVQGVHDAERIEQLTDQLVRQLPGTSALLPGLEAVGTTDESPQTIVSALLPNGDNGNGHAINGFHEEDGQSPASESSERPAPRRARKPKWDPAQEPEMENLVPNAASVLRARYLARDTENTIVETPKDLFVRVAQAVAEGERNFKAKDAEVLEWSHKYYDLMASLRFLPNSPTMVNAGKDGRGSLSACFVTSPEDSMDSIMQVAYDAAMIEKWGGGIGFGFSNLRPKGDPIATTHGMACGPVAVMKLYSAVGATLTQGAFRLGAHMGQLSVTHPDVREFIHAKDDDASIQNFNISVQITDEFMEAVRANADWNLVTPRTGEVVQTIRAKELWREICESAWKTGDPGIVFMDRVLETAPNPQMGLIQTSNPCVTGDTLVYTGQGLVPIRDLVDEMPTLSLDSRSGAEASFATKVWQSGVKPVYRLVTKEGHTLKLTADHKVFTDHGKVPASELKPGDRIQLLDHKGAFGTFGDRNLGLVLGWLTGDGHIDVKRAVLSFYGDDQALGMEMAEATQAVVAGTGQRPTRTYPTDMHLTDAGRGMIQSTRLRDVVRDFGLTEEDWHHIPDAVYQGTEEMQSAYLQALFGADGTVTGSGPSKGVSVRLNSSYPPLLEGVQRLLLNFGIASRIYQRRSERMTLMPDGKGGGKEYRTAANFEVVIGKDNVKRFAEEIGFLSERKNDRLQDAMAAYKEGFYQERFFATFQRLEPLGEEPVYDLTEPMTHSFVANGFCVSNCGEEFLEDYGNCCLGSIDLGKHMTASSDGSVEFDWEALESTVRLGVRFLDDVIEVNTFPIPKLRETNLATRRIGLGIMGWADALVAMGVPYDSDQAIDLASRMGQFIKDTAWSESANLAAVRGTFPEYERSALKERGMGPVRHSSVVTIAPTGSISRIADCSSGIEPHFALAWWSNILWEDNKGGSARFLDAPVPVRQALVAEIGEDEAEQVLERLADDPSYVNDAVLDLLAKHGVRTAMAISPEWHVRMQAAWQNNVTNSVSKTINLANDATVEDVDRAFLMAWETGCKAITVYRDGSKSMQVLETGTSSPTQVALEDAVRPTPRERPAVIRGVTERIRTGHGTMYVTINFDEAGSPFEVFSALGKAGGCDSAYLEAISRLVSLALRSGVDEAQVIDQLRGITCCPTWDQGVLVSSSPDAVALAMLRHEAEHHPSEVMAAARQEAEATQISLFTEKPQVKASQSAAFAPQQQTGSRMRGLRGNQCPECYSNLTFEEGCMKCYACGYSKC